MEIKAWIDYINSNGLKKKEIAKVKKPWRTRTEATFGTEVKIRWVPKLYKNRSKPLINYWVSNKKGCQHKMFQNILYFFTLSNSGDSIVIIS